MTSRSGSAAENPRRTARQAFPELSEPLNESTATTTGAFGSGRMVSAWHATMSWLETGSPILMTISPASGPVSSLLRPDMHNVGTFRHNP